MPIYIKIALNPRIIKIIPPEISKYFEGNFLKKFPNQKPATDIKNDIKPIRKTDNKIGVFVKFKLTPEASASILVAIPRLIRHFKSKQQIFSSFSLNAS